MIRLYRSLNFFKDVEILYDNEYFFNNMVEMDAFNELFLNVMMTIDKAKLLDKKLGTIETPYGVCNRECLSIGCKTVLNLIYLMNNKDRFIDIKAINATECGLNAIEKMLDIIDDYKWDIGVIIRHSDNMFKCKSRKYIIDNEIKTDNLLMDWLK